MDNCYLILILKIYSCWNGHASSFLGSAGHSQVSTASLNTASDDAYHTLLYPSSSPWLEHPMLNVVNPNTGFQGRRTTGHILSINTSSILHISYTFSRWEQDTDDFNRSSQWFGHRSTNDPSTGSPMETLLRLLLPLSDKAHQIFYSYCQICTMLWPNYLPEHSISRSDGRCVQSAGT